LSFSPEQLIQFQEEPGKREETQKQTIASGNLDATTRLAIPLVLDGRDVTEGKLPG
jgi:hypothetical protein